MQNLYLGIELGSTRIKAVLIDDKGAVISGGSHDWENSLVNGYWTYPLQSVWEGIQGAYAKLSTDYSTKTGEKLTSVCSVGISAMMHGYLPFDSEGELLAPFRTWRNTNTTVAAEKLTEILNFNIPERWSIAHLYQCVLDNEEHVKDIAFFTTLAGYVHMNLTGEKVLGIGDASGMFPIDSRSMDFDEDLLAKTDSVLSGAVPFKLRDVMPRVLAAGQSAGTLSEQGAKLLDPTGNLNAGIPLCPPEGDAGTGMVATNSVAKKTGNVSAGTSVFAMIVLEKALAKLHKEIDLVTTPCGSPVAMVHCNTCTSDINAWVNMMFEVVTIAGSSMTKPQLFDLFYEVALKGDPDCDGLLSYNFFAGEPVVNVEHGKPLFVRRPDSNMSFANFARSVIYGSIAVLKIGMDILFVEENVSLDTLLGHGGLFKAPIVGQKLLAGALNAPVAVTENSGEGGPWGMALLASYMLNKQGEETLGDFLANRIFKDAKTVVTTPCDEDINGFASYIESYKNHLTAEIAAGLAK